MVAPAGPEAVCLHSIIHAEGVRVGSGLRGLAFEAAETVLEVVEVAGVGRRVE